MYHVTDSNLRILSTFGYLFQAKDEAIRLSATAACVVFVVASNGNVVSGY